MKTLLKSICALMFCLLMLAGTAFAADCFVIDVDLLDMGRLNNDAYVAANLSAGAQGLRIRKYISSSSELAATVRVTLTQMSTKTLVFDKNYGYQSGTFDSGVVYLPSGNSGTVPYLITLYVGDYVYALPFMHTQNRLESNGACTTGVRLRDLDPAQSNDWLMGTMLDLNDLRRQGSCTVEICASNSYVIGMADISLNGSKLNVSVRFAASADVVLRDAQLYVLTDGQYLKNAQSRPLQTAVDVSGAQTAFIYLPMEVSYSTDGLSAYRYDGQQAAAQQQLWSSTRTVRSVQSAPESSWSDGWSDGWDDGWSSGW